MMRKAVHLVIQLMALTLSSACLAGHYEVTSATLPDTTVTQGSGTTTQPGMWIGSGSGGYLFGGAGVGFYDPQYNGRGASFGGKATFRVEWIPSYSGEPHPKTLIRKLSVSTGASSSNSTGNICETYGYTGQIGSYSAADSGSTRLCNTTYTGEEVVTGEAFYDLEVPVSAIGYTPGYGAGGTGVSYRISIDFLPIYIELSNARYINGLYDILVGKKATAYLHDYTSTTTTFKNLQWTVSGQPIRDFAVLGGLSNPTPNTGGPVALQPANLTVQNPYWYWWTSGEKTVTCSGTMTRNGVDAPFEAESKIFARYPQAFELGVSPVEGREPEPPTTSALSVFRTIEDGTSYQFDSKGSDGEPAMRFRGRVSDVSEAPTFYSAKWFFLQLVERRQSAKYEKIGSQDPPIRILAPLTVQAGLDGSLAYGYSASGSTGTQRVDGDNYFASDSPTANYAIDLTYRPGYTLTSGSMDWRGKMFLMYQPSGVDSIPVPLSESFWQWRASQSLPFPADEHEIPNSSTSLRGTPVFPIEFPAWSFRYSLP